MIRAAKSSISVVYANIGAGPEWCEKYIADSLREKGFNTELFEVFDPGSPRGGLIVNRVYASASNGNGAADRSLELSRSMENKGRRVINPGHSMPFDYDKFRAYESMKEAGVPTPKTRLIEEFESAMEACEEFGYPVIMKRNTGGRSIGIKLLEDPKAAKIEIKRFLGNGDCYHGSMLLQEFIRPQRSHDVRIGIIDGKPIISYGRTLISLNGETPWLACVARGSEMMEYEPDTGEIDVAMMATAALGAEINEVDLCIGPNGPVAIENNLTPSYDNIEIPRVKKIIEYIAGEAR